MNFENSKKIKLVAELIDMGIIDKRDGEKVEIALSGYPDGGDDFLRQTRGRTCLARLMVDMLKKRIKDNLDLSDSVLDACKRIQKKNNMADCIVLS